MSVPGTGKNTSKGTVSMKPWKKARVSGAERPKRLWGERAENIRRKGHVET